MFFKNFSHLIQLLLLLAAWPLQAQWTTARLSEARLQPQAIVSGNKALFIAGIGDKERGSARVDIFDANMDAWSMRNLPRSPQDTNPNYIAAANGERVFFINANAVTDEVQIYRPSDNTWATARLSEPRAAISIGAAGEYVVFAGGINPQGYFSETVDLYNVQTGKWKVLEMSEARTDIAIAGLGNKIFMAGGFTPEGASDRVDILTAEGWNKTIKTLSAKRGRIEAVSAWNKVVFAGGSDAEGINRSEVDIFDDNFGGWSSSTMTLADNAGSLSSVVVGNKIYFNGASNLGILETYDAAYGTWDIVPIPTQHASGSFAAFGEKIFLADLMGIVQVFDCVNSSWDTLGSLSQPRIGLTGVAVGNKLLFAGGYCCTGYSDIVDIYTGIASKTSQERYVSLQPPYPNPAHTRVFVPLPPDATFLRLFNSDGCLEQSQTVRNLEIIELDVSGLRKGVYNITVEGKGVVYWGRISVE
jgi:hypothetical protein